MAAIIAAVNAKVNCAAEGASFHPAAVAAITLAAATVAGSSHRACLLNLRRLATGRC
jgi:hypothetical protein